MSFPGGEPARRTESEGNRARKRSVEFLGYQKFQCKWNDVKSSFKSRRVAGGGIQGKGDKEKR